MQSRIITPTFIQILYVQVYNDLRLSGTSKGYLTAQKWWVIKKKLDRLGHQSMPNKWCIKYGGSCRVLYAFKIIRHDLDTLMVCWNMEKLILALLCHKANVIYPFRKDSILLNLFLILSYSLKYLCATSSIKENKYSDPINILWYPIKKEVIFDASGNGQSVLKAINVFSFTFIIKSSKC